MVRNGYFYGCAMETTFYLSSSMPFDYLKIVKTPQCAHTDVHRHIWTVSGHLAVAIRRCHSLYFVAPRGSWTKLVSLWDLVGQWDPNIDLTMGAFYRPHKRGLQSIRIELQSKFSFIFRFMTSCRCVNRTLIAIIYSKLVEPSASN